MMSKKRKIRELAMQVLFAWDIQGAVDNEAAWQIVEEGSSDAEVRASALEMAGAVWEKRAEYDQRVERVAPQWPPRRQPIVDRNLIRQAIWELTHRDTPPKVVLDEAIELAKEFSTEQSAAFVNGVLDAVLKEHQQLLKELTPGAPMVPMTVPTTGPTTATQTPDNSQEQAAPSTGEPPLSFDI